MNVYYRHQLPVTLIVIHDEKQLYWLGGIVKE